MATIDELCLFARAGQTAKMQKYLQMHNIDVNTLNLYGESPLSTATFHNQLSCVELLLAHHADPKLRLAAGHTAIHIACQLANLTILKLFLTVKKDPERSEEEQQRLEERHVYECLRIPDYSNLTPIHWAATQENVSKRQKIFAFLDQRMPGVLDSRYNLNWFQTWAKIHPWVIESKPLKMPNTVPPIRTVPKLSQKDDNAKLPSTEGTSLPLMNINAYEQRSTHEYERTPRAPPTATTLGYYEEMLIKQHPTSLSTVEHPSKLVTLPITPTTGHLAPPAKSSSRRADYQLSSTPKSKEDRVQSRIRTQPGIVHPHSISSSTSQKTPYTQRLGSMISKLSLSSPSCSTYRAERARVIPSGHLPPSPIDLDEKDQKTPDHEEVFSPSSSKRPSHNLLSNIVPTSSTPSTEASSRQSSKPFAASFGFDTSMNVRTVSEETPSTPNANPTDSLDEEDEEEEQIHYQSNPFDYICQTASTFGIPSPGSFHHPSR